MTLYLISKVKWNLNWTAVFAHFGRISSTRQGLLKLNL